MKIKLTLILIIQLLLGPLAWAQEVQSSQLQQYHWDLELKSNLFNSMVRTNERLNLKWNELESRSLAPADFDRQWAQNFQEITREYVETQLKIGGFDSRQMGPIRQALNRVNWDQASQLFSKTFRSMRNFARVHGTSLLAVLIVSNITQWIMIPVLTMIGQPLLALIVMNFPTTIPTIYLHHVITNAQLERQMRLKFGSREAYREYKALDKRVLQTLKLNSMRDVLIPLEGGEDLVALRRTGLITSIAQHLGLAEDHLNLATMRRFLQNAQLTDPVLWGLLNDRNLGEKTKLIMMIHHLHNNSEPEIFAKFKLHFSKSFASVSSDLSGLASLERWTIALMASRSPQDIEQLLLRIPRDVPPPHFIAAWSEVILPELAKGDQLSYGQIRQLTKRFFGLKVQMEVDPQEWNHQRLAAEFSQYFNSSLNSGLRACYRSQSEVIRQLLSAP